MWMAIASLALNFLSSKEGQEVAGKAINGATQLAGNVTKGSDKNSGFSLPNLLANPAEAIKAFTA